MIYEFSLALSFVFSKEKLPNNNPAQIRRLPSQLEDKNVKIDLMKNMAVSQPEWFIMWGEKIVLHIVIILLSVQCSVNNAQNIIIILQFCNTYISTNFSFTS